MGRRVLRKLKVVVVVDNNYNEYQQTYDIDDYDTIEDLFRDVQENAEAWVRGKLHD